MRVVEDKNFRRKRLHREAVITDNFDDVTVFDVGVIHRGKYVLKNLPPSNVTEFDRGFPLQRLRDDDVELKEIGDVAEDITNFLIREINRERFGCFDVLGFG